MLFRVSGKLADSRPFASRVESDNALSAVAGVRKSLNDSGVQDTDIRELVSRPLAGKSSVHIGKAKSAPAAATPAKKK